MRRNCAALGTLARSPHSLASQRRSSECNQVGSSVGQYVESVNPNLIKRLLAKVHSATKENLQPPALALDEALPYAHALPAAVAEVRPSGRL
jgi:hypothetical protein